MMEPITLSPQAWDAAIQLGVLKQVGFHWYLEGRFQVVRGKADEEHILEPAGAPATTQEAQCR